MIGLDSSRSSSMFLQKINGCCIIFLEKISCSVMMAILLKSRYLEKIRQAQPESKGKRDLYIFSCFIYFEGALLPGMPDVVFGIEAVCIFGRLLTIFSISFLSDEMDSKTDVMLMMSSFPTYCDTVFISSRARDCRCSRIASTPPVSLSHPKLR